MTNDAAPALRGALVALLILIGTPDRSMRAFASNASGLEAVTWETTRSVALPTLHGGRVASADYRGRILLVHFFATWCEPCRPELASLDRLRDEAGPRGLEILAVSVAEVETRLRRFFSQSPVRFPVLLDSDRAVARAWGIDVLPSTVVLDRDGRPRLSVRGDLDWQRPDVRAALDTLMAESRPGSDPQQREGN